MLYSFCSTSLMFCGVIAPWQAVEAQDPGPVYFPAPGDGAAADCARAIEGKKAVNRRAAAHSSNEREGVDWGNVIMSRSAGILYPNFPRRQSPISIRPIQNRQGSLAPASRPVGAFADSSPVLTFWPGPCPGCLCGRNLSGPSRLLAQPSLLYPVASPSPPPRLIPPRNRTTLCLGESR